MVKLATKKKPKPSSISHYELGEELYALNSMSGNFSRGQKVMVTEQTAEDQYVIDDVVEMSVQTIDENFSREVVLPPSDITNVASTEVMNKALELVAREFNLGKGYVMTSFKDEGSRCTVTMNSRDFEVTVKVKDTIAQGIRTVD